MVAEDYSGRALTDVVVNRILLIEADAETAQSMKTLLESQKFTVLTAKDGGQAQSIFVMRKPDFVITELILKGDTGFEICERFKQTDKTVPVLVVSEIELDQAKKLATRVGADGYLVKPVQPEVLLTKIREIAENAWWEVHSDRPREDRRVRFSCSCGKRFRVSPVHRGKSLTCPECGEPTMVPIHD
jgi:DNA-binding response OmpR family regulator